MSILSLLYIKFKFISLYFNFSNILSLISVPLVMLQLINLLYYVYKDLRTKSTDLYQFKITNFYYTFFCIGLYIVFFILLIYGLRIVYINKTLDLRALYYRLYDLVILFMLLPFMLRFYVIFVLILSLLLILFVFVNIQTVCYKEFFKLHIYLSDTNPSIREYKSKFRSKYSDYLSTWGNYNIVTPEIISGYLKYLVCEIKFYIIKFPKIKITKLERLLFYIFGNSYYRNMRHMEKKTIKSIHNIIYYIFDSKYYKYLFHISPILVILYDCYFHDWILTHIFYYIVIYGPLVTIKKITNSTFSLCTYSITLLRQLYYESLTYDDYMFCVAKDLKEMMIDAYLLRELQHNYDILLEGIEESNYLYLICNLTFTKDKDNPNMYNGEEGIILIKTEDNKLYRMIYEHKLGEFELGEEWIVLEDKYGIERPWTKVEYDKEEEINI